MEITNELDNKFSIYSYTIYTTYTWCMLMINSPTLRSIHHLYIYYDINML